MGIRKSKINDIVYYISKLTKYISILDDVDKSLSYQIDQVLSRKHELQILFVDDRDIITTSELSCELLSNINTLVNSLNKTKQQLARNIELYSIISNILECDYKEHEEESNDMICTNCASKMDKVEDGSFRYECPNCLSTKSNTDLYISLADPQHDNIGNDNHTKHFNKNIDYMYGKVKPKNLSDEVFKIICKEIKRLKPNLLDEVHYSYEIIEQLKHIVVEHEGKRYEAKKYKIYSNTFLINAFPELEFPVLSVEDSKELKETFLIIAAGCQRIYTGRYIPNYLFIIHRILYMNMFDRPNVKDLLKFIFIQYSKSFKKKDEKLKNVNDKINCFKEFLYVPADIYTNLKYYE